MNDLNRKTINVIDTVKGTKWIESNRQVIELEKISNELANINAGIQELIQALKWR